MVRNRRVWRRVASGIAVVTLAVVASGCDWTMYRGGGTRSGFNDTEKGAGAISTSNAASLHALPAVAIPGINGSQGQSSPVSGFGRYWVNGNDGVLHVLDATGHQVAALRQPGMKAAPEMPATPTLANNRVYVADAYKLYAWDAKTLAPLSWSPKTLSNSIAAHTPFVLETPVYVPERDSLVVVAGLTVVMELSAADGHTISQFNALNDYVSSPPAVAGHWLYFGTNSGNVAARDLTKKGKNWTITGTSNGGKMCAAVQGAKAGLIASVIPVGDKLIVDRCGDRVMARATSNGKVLWKAQRADKSLLQPLGSPAVAYGKVYFQTSDGWLHMVDLNSGADLASFNALKGAAVVSVANGVLFTAPGVWVLDANTLAARFFGGILAYNEAAGAVAEAGVANGVVFGLSNGAFVGWALK